MCLCVGEGSRDRARGAHWRCFRGNAYCHFGTFSCASCLYQDGRESNWSDSSHNGNCKMPVLNPLSGSLDEYLTEGSMGRYVAGLWHSSSVCVICPTRHSSDSSQMRFDGGDYLFGYVELPLPLTVWMAGALSPNLNPHGFEGYALDQPTPDDDEDLFSSGSGLSGSDFVEG